MVLVFQLLPKELLAGHSQFEFLLSAVIAAGQLPNVTATKTISNFITVNLT